MTKSARLFSIIALVLATFASPAIAQLPGPTPEHAKLKEFEGTWNFVLKTSDGTESKGVSTFKLECGGMWLVSDFKTEMAGAPFQGKGLDGYDPSKKKYISVWVDSFATAPLIFEGDYDKKSKDMVMTAEGPAPGGNGTAKWRSVTKIISPDEHTFEMFLAANGRQEMSMMVVTYKRAK